MGTSEKPADPLTSERNTGDRRNREFGPDDFVNACDQTLQSYLNETDDDEAEHKLTRLFPNEQWNLKRLITCELWYYPPLRAKERDEEATAILQLGELYIRKRLKELRRQVMDARKIRNFTLKLPIEQFEPYVYTVLRNECYNRLRTLYPERARLKRRLEDAASKPEFAIRYLEYGADHALARYLLLNEWVQQERRLIPQRLDKTIQRKDYAKAVEIIKSANTGRSPKLRVLLAELLRTFDAPLRLDEILAICVDQWDLMQIERAETMDELGLETLQANRATVSADSSRHTWEELRAIWDALQVLSSSHRKLLLLSSVNLELFLIHRVVSRQEIAKILETDEAKIDGLLKQLPLRPEEIGNLVGLEASSVPVYCSRIRKQLKTLFLKEPVLG